MVQGIGIALIDAAGQIANCEGEELELFVRKVHCGEVGGSLPASGAANVPEVGGVGAALGVQHSLLQPLLSRTCGAQKTAFSLKRQQSW